MKPFPLLSRDQFRAAVFQRDGHKCVICGEPAKDAHHILERKLWGASGGYYLANGVSVCETHHLEAEATTLSCAQLRERAGITAFPLPEHLTEGDYDKWGNPILPNGLRLRGELFDDPSVQKVLGASLALFTDRVKYPRTFHLPSSPGASDDDKVLTDLSAFEGREVVVTVKMDGENTTMYPDYMHARSLDYSPHPSRSWIKGLHAAVGPNIPSGWRICGENLFARHSIEYANLSSYFQLFSVWNDRNECLSWDETVQWAELLDLTTVPVLYRGPWTDDILHMMPAQHLGDTCEGYVVRLAGSFTYREFVRSVAKYVRAGHVQTDEHWKHQAVVPNGLRTE